MTHNISHLDLLQQLNLFELLLKHSVIYSVFSLDMNGVILNCNECAEINYGYSISELIGNNISTLFDKNPIQNNLNNKVPNKIKTQRNIIAVNKDKRKHSVNINLMYRSNSEMHLTGYLFITHSVDQVGNYNTQASQECLQLALKNTELEDINYKMHEIARLKDEFLANMSHDLRTPLNGIIGFAEIMIDGKVGPVSNEHKEYLDEILSAAHLLILLINDILDLAKIESGKMEFFPEKVDLFSLLDEIRNIFNKIITEKRIHLKIKINPALRINLDPNKLKQVLYNLASNAFKFTPHGGSVTITADPEGENSFIIKVKDTGIGIAKSDFNKLFVAFQQIESSTPTKYHGTGLGLALARRIIEAQNGKITVDSIVGQGSTFSVILPCSEPQARYGYVSKNYSAKLEKQTRILVIEETSQESTEFVSDLKRAGYIVSIANNIDEAIEKGDISNSDAIILDFFTSDINKWKLLRAFRSRMPFLKAPALLMTGVVNNVAAFGFKIHDFLLKPVKAKEVLDALSWSGINPHSKKMVLIIDNDKNSFLRHKKVLTKFGYQLTGESSFERALKVIAEKHPDVLILNPFMRSGKMSGFDFLQKLRLTEKDKYTPILITTIKVLNKTEREHIKGVVQRVLLKKEGLSKTLLNEIFRQFPLPHREEMV